MATDVRRDTYRVIQWSQRVIDLGGTDMIDTLRKLVDSLEHLPERQQEEVARRLEPIIEEVSDSAWDQLLATPESIAFLDELAAEADAERQAGDLIDLDAALASEE